jgi:hypothetical protein
MTVGTQEPLERAAPSCVRLRFAQVVSRLFGSDGTPVQSGGSANSALWFSFWVSRASAGALHMSHWERNHSRVGIVVSV